MPILPNEVYGVLDIITLRLSFIYGYVDAYGFTTTDFLASDYCLDPLSVYLPWGSAMKAAFMEDEVVNIESPGLDITVTRNFSYPSGYLLQVKGKAAKRLIKQARSICHDGIKSACEQLNIEMPHIQHL